MSELFKHEAIYRPAGVMEKIRTFPITICGAGAVGANLAEALVRSGFGELTVIDMDRVEAHNLSTQPYQRADVGALKAKMLANHLYRAVGAELHVHSVELTCANAGRLLSGALVVDAFDNSTSRRVVTEETARKGLPCLHLGLAGDYAEVIWNERYRVPSDQNDDVCDYPLARNLVMLAVSVGAETILDFVANGAQRSHTLTLRDFAITSY